MVGAGYSYGIQNSEREIGWKHGHIGPLGVLKFASYSRQLFAISRDYRRQILGVWAASHDGATERHYYHGIDCSFGPWNILDGRWRFFCSSGFVELH